MPYKLKIGEEPKFICPECGHENPFESNHCEKCGR